MGMVCFCICVCAHPHCHGRCSLLWKGAQLEEQMGPRRFITMVGFLTLASSVCFVALGALAPLPYACNHVCAFAGALGRHYFGPL
jgi:hypothetical protein